MPRSIQLDCPAKANLALEVGRLCLQSKLHPIQSWMVAIDLCDRLQVTAIDEAPANNDRAPTSTPSAFTITYAEDAPSPREIDWPIENDLAFRAHQQVEARSGKPLPVECRLEKRIPTGAGLGGGSSDAAGMILALDRLFGLQLTPHTLSEIASTLGSDVHFALAALTGTPSAVVSGSGDHVEPAPLAAPISMALIMPTFGCPTGPVYQAFDRLQLGREKLSVEAMQKRPQASNIEPQLLNDLSAAAIDVAPELGQIIDRLRDELHLSPHITGSGSASFVIADSREHAYELATKIRGHLGVPAVATTTWSE